MRHLWLLDIILDLVINLVMIYTHTVYIYIYIFVFGSCLFWLLHLLHRTGSHNVQMPYIVVYCCGVAWRAWRNGARGHQGCGPKWPPWQRFSDSIRWQIFRDIWKGLGCMTFSWSCSRIFNFLLLRFEQLDHDMGPLLHDLFHFGSRIFE